MTGAITHENLNQLVNRLGDEEMKKEWWELSWTKNKQEERS